MGSKSKERIVKLVRFPEGTPMASTRVQMGMTLRPQQYESINISVAVERPCLDNEDEITRAGKRAAKLILGELPVLIDMVREAYEEAG